MATDEAANPKEPYWLLWAREIQALAQTGLAFTRDQYDRERYQRLRALAAEIMAEHAGANMPDINPATPPQSWACAARYFGTPGYCWCVRQRISIDGHCREAGRM